MTLLSCIQCQKLPGLFGNTLIHFKSGVVVKKIKQNDNVLFFYNDSKKWLMRVSKKQQFHTHIGIIDHKKVIGKQYGNAIKTNKGKIIYLLEPTIYDFVMKSQRSTQIVYPTMNQLEKLVTALRQNDFFDIECTEQIVRTIEAREGKTRHSFRGIGHTTYVAFARKVTTPKELRRIVTTDSEDIDSDGSKLVEDESLSSQKK